MGGQGTGQISDERKARLDADPPFCVKCGTQIEAPRRYAPNVKYCNEHGFVGHPTDPKQGGSWRRDRQRTLTMRARVDAAPPQCEWCHKVIKAPRRYQPNVKFCDDKCRSSNRIEKQKHKMRLDQQVMDDAEFELELESGGRAGRKYDEIKSSLEASGEWEDWLDGKITHAKLANRFKVTAQAMGRFAKTGRNQRLTAVAKQGWEPKPRHKKMLGPSDQDMKKLLADKPKDFDKALDDLTEAFVKWRNEFFQAGFDTAYITRPMHRKWIRNTLKTIYTGGRELILSPPRHGKTDLLIHFCVWLICRNPNIRILWVGPNGDIAENCLGQVRDLLETHEDLQAAYLPHGDTWAPHRKGGGALWSRQRFTVANRTLTLKMPTMWCTGVGGKILSLDCDFIIVDDPADPDDSQTPGGRDKIEKWFKIKLITRKMNHTGLAMISSRVHPEDLYSEFVDSDNWEVVVDRAHDQAICHHDLWEDHGNDDTSCVLFPEVNPLQYLREQQDVVGDALFEMMYLNQPRPDGTMIFDIDTIRAECLDFSRSIGIDGLGGNYRLVAGLDPASRGVQAAFLWAVSLPTEDGRGNRRDQPEQTTYFMIDLETQRAGGPAGAHAVMREWFEKYGVTLWIVEDNAYQSVFFDDPRTKNLSTELGLDIRPTHTGQNKHDPDFGVAGMAPLFHDGHVNLPYADVEARRKVEQYLKQLVNFTGDIIGAKSRKHLSDILMASWFPHATVIRKWRREARHRRVQQNVGGSFPEYDSPSYNDAPWTTNYPGR